jgi:predicted DCC family thiol-disulfide oxidoreductase YuxK
VRSDDPAAEVGVSAPPPALPTVIYNDACGFCRRWADHLRRWDRSGRVALLPLEDDRAPALAARSRSELEQAVHAILPSGQVLSGAAAIRSICGFLPGGWVIRLVLSVPGTLAVAERVYGWVARRWGPVGP